MGGILFTENKSYCKKNSKPNQKQQQNNIFLPSLKSLAALKKKIKI